MDTEKQRQRRRDGARLTERSEQLLVVPTESLTNRQQLLGVDLGVDLNVEGPAGF